MDVRSIALIVSLTVVGFSLTAMMWSVMQHHASKPGAENFKLKSAALDFMWTLVPCCMMLLLMGTGLKAAWAN